MTDTQSQMALTEMLKAQANPRFRLAPRQSVFHKFMQSHPKSWKLCFNSLLAVLANTNSTAGRSQTNIRSTHDVSHFTFSWYRSTCTNYEKSNTANINPKTPQIPQHTDTLSITRGAQVCDWRKPLSHKKKKPHTKKGNERNRKNMIKKESERTTQQDVCTLVNINSYNVVELYQINNRS